jgi:hypothetical protein
VAILQFPTAVSSVTLSTSGVTPVTAGKTPNTVTPDEATLCVQGWQLGSVPKAVVSAANGNMTIRMPSVITSITINGNVYAVAGGNITAVLPADATPLLSQGIGLVVG